MSLNISSETIDNPLLIELLRQLNRTFSKIDSDFFVIGATARDIILRFLANTSVRRKTKDLDIAIAVTGWDKYNEICQALIADGFEKSTHQVQRFYFGDYEVDMVPYGAVAKVCVLFQSIFVMSMNFANFALLPKIKIISSLGTETE